MASGPFTGIDHVQLAMPVGGEDTARSFYCSVLGRPKSRNRRNWQSAVDAGLQAVLYSSTSALNPTFALPGKHPALRYSDYDALVARLRAAGVEVKTDDTIPAVRRCHVFDPLGNRIELIRS